MVNFKKLFLISASAVTLMSTAFAAEVKTEKMPVVSDLEVKLSGFAHFQSAYRNQSKLTSEEKNLSHNRKDFAFYNQTAMAADVSNKVEEVKYGGKIVLVPTAKRKGGVSYNGSHMYVESDFGKVELGSPIPPSSVMMIEGETIIAGTADWDDYADFTPSYLQGNTNAKPSFATFAEFFLDSKLTTKLDNRKYSSEPARSIVYYTPKFDFGGSTKIQVGISYIPDSSNTGADNPSSHSSGIDEIIVSSDEIHRFKIDRTVKDAISGGVCLEQNFADGVDMKIAVTGEYGKSAGKAKRFAKEADKTPNASFSLSNLRTFNIGAVLNVGNFSYAGSFGSLGKSLTTPEFHKTGRKTDYYSGAIAYKQGPFSTSVAYFKSNQFKNTVDAVTIGADYQVVPGLKPYAELSGFSLKGRPEFDSKALKKKTRGTVAIVGAKLSL
ncbi:MAG: porin [Rickettsiaceae bacterium]